MPLTLPDAPAEGLAIVGDYVPRILAAMGRTLDSGELEVAPPYPLYTFAIHAVLGDAPLKAARQTAWEYLLVRGEEIFGLAEVAVARSKKKEKLGYATLHPRAFAAAIASRIADAEKLPQVKNDNYELRILRAPSLTLLAIWLQRDGADLLLPVRNWATQIAAHSLDGSDLSDEQGLVGLLRPLAQQRLNAHD